jgi:pyridoxal phosphate enzyme (YggS family)
MSVAIAVQTLQGRIKNIINTNPLSNSAVTLLAASKSQSATSIIEAIDAGVTDFGENRVQEAEEKWSEIRKRYPHIRLHLIGPLQTNKVKQALELFDVIQTLDRPKLAESIAAIYNAQHPHIVTRSFYIQVNTGKEPQKAGVIPEETDALIERCIKELRLPVTGLMCIPPVDVPLAPHFALLKGMAERHQLPELSMGMSDDFETAIRMGSTCVRIGRALFGERKPDETSG